MKKACICIVMSVFLLHQAFSQDKDTSQTSSSNEIQLQLNFVIGFPTAERNNNVAMGGSFDVIFQDRFGGQVMWKAFPGWGNNNFGIGLGGFIYALPTDSWYNFKFHLQYNTLLDRVYESNTNTYINLGGLTATPSIQFRYNNAVFGCNYVIPYYMPNKKEVTWETEHSSGTLIASQFNQKRNPFFRESNKKLFFELQCFIAFYLTQ